MVASDCALACRQRHERRLRHSAAILSGGWHGLSGSVNTLEHLTLEMFAYGRQKPAYSHFVARIFRKILAEHLTHFIRKLLWRPGLFQSGARASCAMSQQMAAGKARVTVLSGRGPWVNPKKCGAPKGCAQGHAREPGAWLFCSSKDYGTGAVNPLYSLTAPAVSPCA